MISHAFFSVRLQRLLRLDRALALLWHSAPAWTLANVVLTLLQGLVPLVLLYLTKLIIDTLTIDRADFSADNFVQRVFVLIALAGGTTLFNLVCRSLAEIVSETQAGLVTDHVYELLHTKSVAMDLAYYENPHYYDTLHRAQEDAPFRPISILNTLVQLGRNGISLLAMSALLASFHWGVALLLLFAVLPQIFIRLRYSGEQFRWQRSRTSTERRSWYFHWLLTGAAYAKEVRIFELGPLLIRRFRTLRQQLRREKLQLVMRRSLRELFAQLSATLVVFASYAFIAYRALHGSISLGEMLLYYQAFQRGQGFLRGMLGNLAQLYEDSLFLSNLYEFLNLEPHVTESVQSLPMLRLQNQGIVFDGVGFSYPGSSENVLQKIDLQIRPGEKIALVGKNGAGKSTLIKLLCRLYDPTQGSIAFDGTDLRKLQLSSLRRNISVLFQDFSQYNLSARENIWLGNTQLPPESKKIQAAAFRSGADTLIQRLPKGYDSILGKYFDEGEELSGGEWRKIALARAFLREAQIFVLDEPSSSLDAEAEYELFTRFRELTREQTAILISHRFSTVRMADRICVLDKGRIIEHGSHEELLSYDGMYAELFQLQAQHYR